MTDSPTPISTLSEVDGLTGDELVPVVTDEGTKVVTTQTIADLAALEAAGIADGDKGDVEVSSSGTVWSVPGLATVVSDLAAESAARSSADTTLTTAITTEASARSSADTTLQTNITNEASARSSADTTLSTAITTETSRATTAEALLQPLSGKDVASGYAGLSSSGALLTQVQTDQRSTNESRAQSLFLARRTAAVTQELWITDSFGHTGASAPETTSCIARYEQMMSRAQNTIHRQAGFVPAQLATAALGVDSPGIAWDSIPSSQFQYRGINGANKQLLSGDTASVTRTGTSVAVLYTALRSGGAVVNVTINGKGSTTIASGSNGVNTSTFAGAGTLNVADTTGFPTASTISVATGGTLAIVTYTGKTSSTLTGCTTVTGGGVMSTGGAVKLAIDNRDGTVAASPGYNSGRVATFTTDALYGNIALTLTYNTGTAFELEGAYFYSGNETSGHMTWRGSQSGQSLQNLATSAAWYAQLVTNRQPNVITIMAGVNDNNTAAGTTRTGAQMATDLSTFVTALRACYSTWLPTIRYVFQPASTYQDSAWGTTFRAALRAQCATDGVVFIDLHGAFGTSTGDKYDFSDDTPAFHPNDYGHQAIAAKVLDVSAMPINPLVRYLNIGSVLPQVSNTLNLYGTAGSTLTLARNNNVATANADALGLLGFKGATDAYGTLAFGAAVQGVAEEAWTGSTSKAGLRFYTTPTGGGATAIVMSLDGAGNAYHTGGLVVGNNIAPTNNLDVYAFGSTANETLWHAGGTSASKTKTTNTTVLGRLAWRGYEEVTPGYTGALAIISAVAQQDFTATANGTYLSLRTTANGATTSAERLRVNDTAVIATGPMMANNASVATAVVAGRAFDAVTGGIFTRDATSGIGYGTGAGGTVTQGTSKSTGVTLDKVCGTITTHGASLAAGTSVSFTLTNSTIAATDVVVVNIKSGSGADTYNIDVTAVAAGSCRIQIRNFTGAADASTLALNFAVLKGVAS